MSQQPHLNHWAISDFSDTYLAEDECVCLHQFPSSCHLQPIQLSDSHIQWPTEMASSWKEGEKGKSIFHSSGD